MFKDSFAHVMFVPLWPFFSHSFSFLFFAANTKSARNAKQQSFIVECWMIKVISSPSQSRGLNRAIIKNSCKNNQKELKVVTKGEITFKRIYFNDLLIAACMLNVLFREMPSNKVRKESVLINQLDITASQRAGPTPRANDIKAKTQSVLRQ